MKKKLKTRFSYRFAADIAIALDAVMSAEGCEFATETELVEWAIRKALKIQPTRPSIPNLSANAAQIGQAQNK